MIRATWNALTLADCDWQPRVIWACLVFGAGLHLILWLK